MQKYSKLDHPSILSSIFHPRVCGHTPLPIGATDIKIETEPGISIGCRFYISEPAAPNILFFHGNGEIAADYDEIGPHYTKAGMNLLVTDYRGYGWSNGSPTISSMVADAEILFQETLKWLNAHNHTGSLFLMGRSLGSVPAIDLATRHDNAIKGMILESAIAETLPLARILGIDIDKTGLSEEDGFNNLKKIESITKATFILHGGRDELIPAADAEKLQSHSGAKSKEFVVIPGANHNTMIATGGTLYFQTIKQFIDKITGATNWRRRRKTSKES
ncbi:MAG: lysophospholipase [Proteobacteria bacterium]|nr:lysophospholipase [Pseudomonadota bacterium]MBU1056848.1 lysophospholipase [Pseudomonadota bacterium]